MENGFTVKNDSSSHSFDYMENRDNISVRHLIVRGFDQCRRFGPILFEGGWHQNAPKIWRLQRAPLTSLGGGGGRLANSPREFAAHKRKTRTGMLFTSWCPLWYIPIVFVCWQCVSQWLCVNRCNNTTTHDTLLLLLYFVKHAHTPDNYRIYKCKYIWSQSSTASE